MAISSQPLLQYSPSVGPSILQRRADLAQISYEGYGPVIESINRQKIEAMHWSTYCENQYNLAFQQAHGESANEKIDASQDWNNLEAACESFGIAYFAAVLATRNPHEIYLNEFIALKSLFVHLGTSLENLLDQTSKGFSSSQSRFNDAIASQNRLLNALFELTKSIYTSLK